MQNAKAAEHKSHTSFCLQAYDSCLPSCHFEQTFCRFACRILAS